SVSLLCTRVLYVGLFVCFFFFFQAEDGIRDYKVTGVQTCALPIFSPAPGQQRDGRRSRACAGRGAPPAGRPSRRRPRRCRIRAPQPPRMPPRSSAPAPPPPPPARTPRAPGPPGPGE